MLKKLNVKGFAHHLIIPIVVVVAIASVGAYVLVKSRASTPIYISGAFGYNCRTYSPPTLSNGSKGECVKVVQKGVNNWINLHNWFARKIVYPTITVDGIYGTKTQTAVKQYQQNHKLVADSIVGHNTWTVMSNDCAWWGNCFATK